MQSRRRKENRRSRKVRTPQSGVVGKPDPAKAAGKCHRNNRLSGGDDVPSSPARVKRCGKSDGGPATGPRQGKPHPVQGQAGTTTLLAESQVGRTDGWLHATGAGLSTSYGKGSPTGGPFLCSRGAPCPRDSCSRCGSDRNACRRRVQADPGQAARARRPLGHRPQGPRRRPARLQHGLQASALSPDQPGFGANDARFLARTASTRSASGMIYKGLEPDARRGRRRATSRRSRRRSGCSPATASTSLLDFHQDMYNERFEGEGWPDWADDRRRHACGAEERLPGQLPEDAGAEPRLRPLLGQRRGRGRRAWQDAYAEAWRHVASRFRSMPGSMGYDLMNEPWPGSAWPSCISTGRLPGLRLRAADRVHPEMIAAIREVGPAEPRLVGAARSPSTSAPTRPTAIPGIRSAGF